MASERWRNRYLRSVNASVPTISWVCGITTATALNECSYITSSASMTLRLDSTAATGLHRIPTSFSVRAMTSGSEFSPASADAARADKVLAPENACGCRERLSLCIMPSSRTSSSIRSSPLAGTSLINEERALSRCDSEVGVSTGDFAARALSSAHRNSRTSTWVTVARTTPDDGCSRAFCENSASLVPFSGPISSSVSSSLPLAPSPDGCSCSCKNLRHSSSSFAATDTRCSPYMNSFTASTSGASSGSTTGRRGGKAECGSVGSIPGVSNSSSTVRTSQYAPLSLTICLKSISLTLAPNLELCSDPGSTWFARAPESFRSAYEDGASPTAERRERGSNGDGGSDVVTGTGAGSGNALRTPESAPCGPQGCAETEPAAAEGRTMGGKPLRSSVRPILAAALGGSVGAWRCSAEPLEPGDTYGLFHRGSIPKCSSVRARSVR
mmetsp:Transcript_987/g.2803  ORF Transcript_987/g.2803 Transcript_987/m.2803 type:complete len:442 (+) Transcript_987:1774-3099(+)